mmetsp:Transcript_71795/g.191616  ORF Transcript_71795/g.191616 Transcript_71795/m.191616 type:complete len:249 (+) Transcript_71795:261-1007(+)
MCVCMNNCVCASGCPCGVNEVWWGKGGGRDLHDGLRERREGRHRLLPLLVRRAGLLLHLAAPRPLPVPALGPPPPQQRGAALHELRPQPEQVLELALQRRLLVPRPLQGLAVGRALAALAREQPLVLPHFGLQLRPPLHGGLDLVAHVLELRLLGHPALDVAHGLLLPAHEELVLVLELGRFLRHLAEAVEVELPHEGREVAVLEVPWKHYLRESVGIVDNDGASLIAPPHQAVAGFVVQHLAEFDNK